MRLVTCTMILVVALFTPYLVGVAIADDAVAKHEPRPTWCQSGYVCLTTQELAERTAAIWHIRAENANLKYNLSVLRKPWWVSAGLEYLPNEAKTYPYAIGGLRLGRVSVWGGAFGSSPAVGVGWNW